MKKNEKYKGDALLQKTYTADFLTHKRVTNKGELQQFYVENHQGIVDEKTFDLAQAEMRRRRGHTGEYSGKSIFSSKIICGECGCFFGSKTWHSTDKYRKVIWRCNHKYDDGHKCGTPNITKDEIKALYLKALNKLLGDKESFLEDLRILRQTAAETDGLQAEADKVCEAVEAAYATLMDAIARNATVVQDQEAYKEESEKLFKEYEDLQEKHDSLIKQIELSNATAELLDNFIGIIEKMDGEITQFDDRVWAGTVESMTIVDRKKAKVTFKGGIEIEVK